MESRSRRRVRRSPPPSQHGAGNPDGVDRISALPDDMLLQVLVRLRCVRAAARTVLLSRRWSGLWSRLPGLTFRDIPAGEIKSVLTHVARGTGVSLLEFRLPRSTSSAEGKLDDACAKSLLLAAARLSPEEVVFVLPHVTRPGRGVTMVLPCFHHATSVELDTGFLRIKPPPAGDLPVLETLSVSGNIVDVDSLLNRCPRLRVLKITFRGVKPTTLEAELTKLEAAAAALGLTVARLGIEFEDFNRRNFVSGARFASLLRVAASISPEEFLFTSYFPQLPGPIDADLLCFHRAMSIEMTLYNIRFTQLPADEFSALQRLALKGCTVTDLVALIVRCPRLRVLKVTVDKSTRHVRVPSVSLEELELDLERDTECQSIDIVTPLLKHLKLKVCGKMNLGVSISAPMMESVSWCRTYTSLPLIFGFWWLQSLKLETTENYKHRDVVLIDDEEGVSLQQLPRVHVLSMEISSYNHMGVEVDFAREMEEFMVIEFSVLELHLNAKGHVFGLFVSRLLRMDHIRSNTQKLKIILSGLLQMSQASKCLENCPCDEPKDWRSQNISLNSLEEVEIDNFRGEDHEIDFVTSILGWAPMLRRMIIKLAGEIGGCALTIYNICLAYPSLNCSVYLSSGKELSGPRAWL